jgi:hypothetical protein
MSGRRGVRSADSRQLPELDRVVDLQQPLRSSEFRLRKAVQAFQRSNFQTEILGHRIWSNTGVP